MKILIAYDGSSCADAALDDLQKAGLPRSGVEATVIAVAEVWRPPPPPSTYEIVEAVREPQTQAEYQKRYAKASHETEVALALSLRAQQRLQKHFPEWKFLAEATTGSPAWEIIRKADQWKPDLTVVGSQGRSALGRFLLGSVSAAVAARAHCSVEVVRSEKKES